MVRVRLKERDLKFLKFCGEQKFLFKNQVEDWFGVLGRFANKKSSERVARRQLARLKSRGLMDDRVSNFNSAKTWELTKNGVALLKDQGLMTAATTAGFDAQTVNHDQWVTKVRLAALKRQTRMAMDTRDRSTFVVPGQNTRCRGNICFAQKRDDANCYRGRADAQIGIAPQVDFLSI